MRVGAADSSCIISDTMGHIERTVFISYRRTNAPWALAVFQHLHHHGYDVFFDFMGLASGDFESNIIGNIRARAHFLVLLTPSALDGCVRPDDWLRREIETALETKRNIVPLMLEGFDFNTPRIADQLTGQMRVLTRYNALRVPVEYFEAAMGRLRDLFLNVALDTVMHPVSPSARQLTYEQQRAAATAPTVEEQELAAQEYFERGCYAIDVSERVSFFSQAIALRPDFATAFTNRGAARANQGDVEGARSDLDEAIRLDPWDDRAFFNRSLLRARSGDFVGAHEDFDTAIRLEKSVRIRLVPHFRLENNGLNVRLKSGHEHE